VNSSDFVNSETIRCHQSILFTLVDVPKATDVSTAAARRKLSERELSFGLSRIFVTLLRILCVGPLAQSATILESLTKAFRTYSASDEYLVTPREADETIAPVLSTLDILLEASSPEDSLSSLSRDSILEDAKTSLAKHLLVGEEARSFTFPTFSTKTSLIRTSSEGVELSSGDSVEVEVESETTERGMGMPHTSSGSSGSGTSGSTISISAKGLESLGAVQRNSFMASLSTFNLSGSSTTTTEISEMNDLLNSQDNANNASSVVETRLVPADFSQSLTLSFRRVATESATTSSDQTISFSQGM